MDETSYLTAGGVRCTGPPTPFDGGRAGRASPGRSSCGRAAVLSSGMEYPGRYSRWHLAYVDPPVQIVARGKR